MLGLLLEVLPGWVTCLVSQQGLEELGIVLSSSEHPWKSLSWRPVDYLVKIKATSHSH